jgi:putative membrane protein
MARRSSGHSASDPIFCAGLSQRAELIRLGTMHIGKSYKLFEFIAWTRRRAYVLVLLSFLPVVAFELLGQHWIAMPWPVAALLGTAASFIVGFKNAQTYNRTLEAQQVWTSIAYLSRYWGLLCRDLPRERHEFSGLVRRHLAWLTALRYQAREQRVWETAQARSNDEYQRRNFIVAERESPLFAELRKVLLPDELAQVEAATSKTNWLMSAQSAMLRKLYDAQDLVLLHHAEMQKTLKELLDQQARVERLKNFPYPRQYAVINRIFVWSFAAVLPLCLVREFQHVGMVWFAAPFSVLLSWLYAALDQVGESTENPFEGSANDVPISQICRILEAELRTLLGEPDQPSLSFDKPIVL